MDDGLGGQAAVEQREKALGCVQCNSWPDARGVLPLSWLEWERGYRSYEPRWGQLMESQAGGKEAKTSFV